MSKAAEEQVLRYAADLARLYAQAEQDRARLADVEAGLLRIAEASLALARALSLEDAGRRLASAGGELLGLHEVGVYVARRERFALLAKDPHDAPFPAYAPLGADEVAGLGVEAREVEGPPFANVVHGGPAVVVPLLGRRRPVGFLIGTVGSSRFAFAADARATLLALLTGHAGVVLENHLLDDRRGTSALVRPSGPQRRGDSSQALLGRSAPMQEVLRLVARLARVDSALLLTGETGTGKSLVARLMHESGPRAPKPFLTLNCGAIPDALVESELFGHEQGAFTGALKAHRGRVEQAEGGTLFLDEVGELPLQVQTKLLTFLEDRRYTRVGGERELTADVRIVSATNADLERAVAERRFRSDLLYRLNVFTIELPPLRERGADVLELARALAAEVAERYALPAPLFLPEAEARLLAYRWPGNVRELRNVVEKAVILADGGAIQAELLPDPPPATPGAGPAAGPPAGGAGPGAPAVEPFDESLPFADAKARMIERWEVAYLRTLLKTTGGNIAGAARLVQLDKKNLHKKLKQYGIDAGEFRGGQPAPAEDEEPDDEP